MIGRQLVVFAAIGIGTATFGADAFATTSNPPAECVHVFDAPPTQDEYYGMAQDLAVNECTTYCYPSEWSFGDWSSGQVCGWEVVDLFLFEHPVLEQVVYLIIEEVVGLLAPYL